MLYGKKIKKSGVPTSAIKLSVDAAYYITDSYVWYGRGTDFGNPLCIQS